ncbi:adenosine deaminase-like [Oratosquilla oratoria]|uniref:adenosine deaminase-like n=1 Tax=Oratosquilla oratoria TaxID=337810 RepID=UPI003F76B38F
MFVTQQSLKHKPKCRVQLHVHLDGSARLETLWEIMRQKGIPIPGTGSLRDLKESVQVEEPTDLNGFLKGFSVFMPALIDDEAAIERVAYEFVEDQARDSVAYCEVRFCPHLLSSSTGVGPKYLETMKLNGNYHDATTPDDMLKAALKGLHRGEVDFGTKIRVLLCCIRGHSQWSWDILRMCEEYRDQGVVGIDIAGDEAVLMKTKDKSVAANGEEFEDIDSHVFKMAKEKGIHRTVHAGEAGPAEGVEAALDNLHAERIGHGYRVLENPDIYERCIKEKVHFEVCPHSSYLTGAVNHLTTKSKRHPVLRFCEDGVSFSVNTDDPTITGTAMEDECRLLCSWGLSEAHLAKASFEAALHTFLPPEEKHALIAQLQEAFGIVEFSLPAPVQPQSPPVAKPAVTFSTWADRS